MAASLLRIGRLDCIKCLQAGNWSTLSKAPLAVPFSTKSGGSKKWSQKNTSGKKQAKTYFDIEKLVQHKPCEVFPAPAAAAKPAEQSFPSAAVPESVATISGVKAGGQVVETSPSSQAIPDPASTAEVTPAVEMPPAGEAAIELAIAEESVVPSKAMATVTEANPVVESVVEVVTASAKELAESTAPVTEAGTVIIKSPVECATEVPVEMPLEAKPFEPEPLFKASSLDMAPELAAKDAPVDMSLEPLVKAAPIDVAPEPEALTVDEKPAVEAVPVSVAQVAATEAAPVAETLEPVTEAASVEVATPPIEAEVFPVTEAAAEISVPVEKLVDESPVIAEATGEEVQEKVQAKPAEVPEDKRYTVAVFESATEAPPVDEALQPLFKASPVDMALEHAAKDAPVDVCLEPAAEALPVDQALEPAVEAVPVSVAQEAATEAAPVAETLEPMTEAASVEVATPPIEAEVFPVTEAAAEFSVPVEIAEKSVDESPVIAEAAGEEVQEKVQAEPAEVRGDTHYSVAVFESATEASPVDVSQEDATEAALVVEAFEPLTGAAVEVATEEVEVFPATEAAAEISVPVEIAEELVDQPSVIAEAAEEELQEEVPADATEISEAHVDPIKKLFLDSIREYSAKTQATGGLVDASSEYEKALVEGIAKLARLYGGGDLTSFPEFKFKEPSLDEVSQK